MASDKRLDVDPATPLVGAEVSGRNSGFRKARVAFIDIDHTLSDAFWRDELIKPDRNDMSEEDWKAYHKEGHLDAPLGNVIDLVQSLFNSGWLLVMVTARSEPFRGPTQNWLSEHEVPWQYLLMRPDGNRVASHKLKIEQVKHFCQYYLYGDINAASVIVIDDNEEVCQAFKEEGCTVFQVHHTNDKRARSSPLSRSSVPGEEQGVRGQLHSFRQSDVWDLPQRPHIDV